MFQNVIVVLYVFDNDTNPVIKISCFVGLAIECWKVKTNSSNFTPKIFKTFPVLFFSGSHTFHSQVTKVSDCSFDFENKVLGVIPRYELPLAIWINKSVILL